MSGVDVLEVMDSGYWRLFGKLHTLIEDSNNGPKHGSLNTKQLRNCMTDDADAVAVANEARAAVADLIEAAEAYAEAEAALANREIGGINAESIDRLQPRAHAARCDLDVALSRVRGAA